MSNFLISGLVCAQIVLAEKLVEPPDDSCGVPRTPNTELKPLPCFQESFARDRNPSARPSLRAAKRWINRHIITIPFVCFLLLTFYDLPPLWNVH